MNSTTEGSFSISRMRKGTALGNESRLSGIANSFVQGQNVKLLGSVSSEPDDIPKSVTAPEGILDFEQVVEIENDGGSDQ